MSLTSEQYREIVYNFPKDNLELQEIFVKILCELYPLLDAWSQEESYKFFGKKISAKHCLPLFSRDIWRALIVGSAFNGPYSNVLPKLDHSELDTQNSIDWARRGFSLADSVNILLHQLDPSSVGLPITLDTNDISRPVPKLKSKWHQRFEKVTRLLNGSLKTDHPISFLKSNLIIPARIRWPTKNSKILDARTHVLIHSTSGDLSRLLSEGVSRYKWRIVSLEPLHVSSQRISHVRTFELPQTFFPNLSPLIKYLLKDAIKNTMLPLLERHWEHTDAAIKKILSLLTKTPHFFASQPDMSPSYLGSMAACNYLGIPTLEVQHGSQHIRYKSLVNLAWRNLPDHYLTFGEFTNYSSSEEVMQKKVLEITQHHVESHPGVFLRSNYFERIGQRKRKLKNILFGSYVCGDHDLCENSFPDQDMIDQEIMALSALTQIPNIKIHLKIRPGDRYSILSYLPPTLVEKLTIIDGHFKAGHQMVRSFDAVFLCYYSTMLLEAVSVGTPVIYFPMKTETEILTQDFIESIKKSPLEIKMLTTHQGPLPDIIQSALQSFAGTKTQEQDLSLKYARWASPQRVRATVDAIHQLGRTPRPNAETERLPENGRFEEFGANFQA